jgi:ribokinase
MPRIAVVGSANMDLVVRCAALPRPGETVVGRDFSTNPGGKGANQAVAAGRLARVGTQVLFVGCIGEDTHGKALIESLTGAGVDVTHVKTTNLVPTGTALITVNERGENTIVVDHGANALLDPDHVRRALKEIDPEYTLVQLEIPEVTVYACERFGKLILDPAPARLLEPEFLEHVEVITPNESETLALTGIVPLDEFAQQRAARALLEKGIKQVVLKLGAEGCYWTDGRTELHIPAPRVEAVDTTAAGDAFAGALAVFLAEGLDTEGALTNAVKCASYSVTHPGAQGSMPTRFQANVK